MNLLVWTQIIDVLVCILQICITYWFIQFSILYSNVYLFSLLSMIHSIWWWQLDDRDAATHNQDKHTYRYNMILHSNVYLLSLLNMIHSIWWWQLDDRDPATHNQHIHNQHIHNQHIQTYTCSHCRICFTLSDNNNWMIEILQHIIKINIHIGAW